METLVLICAAATALALLFAAIIRAKHPYEAIWVAGLGGVFIVAGLCASIHAQWKKQEAAGQQPSALAEDKRPWLSVVDPSVTDIEEAGDILFLLPIRNTGPTPAREVKVGMALTCAGANDDFDEISKDIESKMVFDATPILIGPGRTTAIQGKSGAKLDKDTILKIQSGELVVRIFCKMKCVDIYGRPQTSWSCHVLDFAKSTMWQDHRYWGME